MFNFKHFYPRFVEPHFYFFFIGHFYFGGKISVSIVFNFAWHHLFLM
jgi:hypothetical protein